jgi:hypothetical protein
VYVCLPLGRAGRCDFGGWGVTNGIRADPCGCAYGSVCGHRAHGVCGPEMGHTTWLMDRRWTYNRALRGKVPGHLLGSVCGHMHACVGLGWGTRHGVWVGSVGWGTLHCVWVGTGWVSWTNKDVGFFEGGGVNVTPDLIWMTHERWCMCLVPHF